MELRITASERGVCVLYTLLVAQGVGECNLLNYEYY